MENFFRPRARPERSRLLRIAKIPSVVDGASFIASLLGVIRSRDPSAGRRDECVYVSLKSNSFGRKVNHRVL
jgi:hypothetical protein